VQENGDTEHNDDIPISDAWWAALAADLLHPIQVQVIEAIQYIDQPLTVRDLSQIVDDIEPVHLDYHLGRLRRLGVLDRGLIRPGTEFMDVRYRLVVERGHHGFR
jgi:DNA-binding transcriptional ArsR family regulator